MKKKKKKKKKKKLYASDAIANTMQYIYDNLVNGQKLISSILEFYNDFDCADHIDLLNKMGTFGLCGVR